MTRIKQEVEKKKDCGDSGKEGEKNGTGSGSSNHDEMLVVVSAGGELMPVFARNQASVSQHRNKQTGGRTLMSCTQREREKKNVFVVAENARKILSTNGKSLRGRARQGRAGT